ncbi:hypothetical protein GCM10007071_17560 [Marinobacter zhanjiangensis]|uniref:Uncharacterized protein n=1 Tax=Marinobacter zhanjiangensis TaxID=578215 RepID=A0ABQ3AXJ3_9GAMM|nr:hypothetical protein GCM10007071_17560 [Marinobacter zhanjiangensis]
MLILLVVVIAGGGWFGWQMHQQVQFMESQLEEADYWARQSKLALARFEGDLSETGENLEETGSSMDERLSGLDTQLEEANDEIRKLWVLANEKNRPRITSLTEQQQNLTEQQENLTGQLETLVSDLEAAGQRVTELQGTTDTLSSGLEQTQQSRQQNSERLQTLSGELESVSDRVGGIDEQVAQQLQRFRQEQSLTLEGLESRLEALETGDGRVQELSRQLTATRNRLAEAERTLESVDASRAQLTSRLVRLQEQVDQLRAR